MTSGNGQWISDSSLYLRPQTGPDAWTQEAASAGFTGSQRLIAVEQAVPPAHVCSALNLAVGQVAVLRRRLILRADLPVEVADSWYPLWVAEGTQLAQARKIKGGAPTLLAALGHRIRSAVEEVESRGAEGHEASMLLLDPGAPVLVLTRLARNHDGEPIEASVMVTPGRERRLRYEMKVD